MSGSALLPRTAVIRAGRLVELGGMEVARLAAEHGTPLYVLDRAELVGRMRAYRQAFGPEVSVAYAAKALCVVGVLQLVAAEGLHVDVASLGELETAVRAGVGMERVLLHGNNKSDAELARALEVGVGRIVVDSHDELDRIERLVAGRSEPVDLLLRVTPGLGAGAHAFIRTGQDDSKFGFTSSTGAAGEAVGRVLARAGMRLAGLHCHVGSQVLDATDYVAVAEAMVGLLAGVRDAHGVELEELNLGGGLGIPYAAGDADPSIDGYARAVLDAVHKACARHGLAVPRLTVEPGRSIAGPAGVTLYEVGTVKAVPGVRTFVAVDGGMSDNIRPALYGARYAFLPAGHGSSAGARGPVMIVGKHCETGDVLGTDVPLGDTLAVGELLAVPATGAYGHSMASNYNRLPRPAMVLVGDGRADLLVSRETVDDVLARDVPLDLQARHPTA